MREHPWNVAVIGGGVAGSATAIALARRGLRVGLIEQSRFDKPRVGEVVAHSIGIWLRNHLDIDLFEKPQVLRSPVHFRLVWGVDTQSTASRQPTHVRIDRTALDRCLFEQARTVGVEAFSDARLSVAKRTSFDEWELGFQQQGKDQRRRAKFVIEATGRTCFSSVSQDRGRLYEDASIACAIRIPSGLGPRLHNQVWIESHEDGWWYISELPNSECLIVFFTDRDLLPTQKNHREAWLAQRWRTSKAGAEVFGRVNLQEFHDSLWSRHDARMSIRQQSFGPGWMTVGDAQMALDPLSGQGIMESLRSSFVAAEFLASGSDRDGLDWAGWAESIAARYHHHRMKRMEQYRLEPAYSQSLYWQRRHRYLDGDFSEASSFQSTIRTTLNFEGTK